MRAIAGSRAGLLGHRRAPPRWKGWFRWAGVPKPGGPQPPTTAVRPCGPAVPSLPPPPGLERPGKSPPQHCFCGVRRLRRLLPSRPPLGNRRQMLHFFQRARGQHEVCRMHLDVQWTDGHPAFQQQVPEASSAWCPVKDYSLGFPSSRGEPWHPPWCQLV
ncbi:Dna Topoisomerase 3-Alpha [Manis pentadactyla]|nr:Dna Topoisomerase 3-Alpha [Manis pentadactyla]